MKPLRTARNLAIAWGLRAFAIFATWGGLCASCKRATFYVCVTCSKTRMQYAPEIALPAWVCDRAACRLKHDADIHNVRFEGRPVS